MQISIRDQPDQGQDVNAVVQMFLDDPRNQATFSTVTAKTKLERRLATAGEVFACLPTDPNTGRVRFRALPPEQITAIVTDPEDADTVWYYLRSYMVGTEQRHLAYPDLAYSPLTKPGDLVGKSFRIQPSDVLKAQLQALRNWSSNHGDINRSFYDTRTSVNSAITDLNVGTKTGMMNEELSTNAARGSRWDDYYESMSDSLAEMANLDQNNYLLTGEIGAAEKEKANYTSVLDWLDSGKNMEDYKSPALASRTAAAADPYTSDYAQRAAQMAGSVWEDPGISADTQNWQGAEQSKTELTNAQPWNAQDNTQLGTKKKRPEGAILRRW